MNNITKIKHNISLDGILPSSNGEQSPSSSCMPNTQRNEFIDPIHRELGKTATCSDEKKYPSEASISMWWERWFLSSNAKDIGTLYLIFALFSGLLGTAFSVLIRLELSGPGVQYISDNQLYNSIITAHAILMIFFMVIPAMIGGLLNKAYTSVEWCLNSPPKPHAFASLPLQGNMSFRITIGISISILVGVSVKLPFVKLLYILNFTGVIPLVCGMCACLVYSLIINLNGKEQPSFRRLVIIFITAGVCSFLFPHIFNDLIGKHYSLMEAVSLIGGYSGLLVLAMDHGNISGNSTLPPISTDKQGVRELPPIGSTKHNMTGVEMTAIQDEFQNNKAKIRDSTNRLQKSMDKFTVTTQREVDWSNVSKTRKERDLALDKTAVIKRYEILRGLVNEKQVIQDKVFSLGLDLKIPGAVAPVNVKTSNLIQEVKTKFELP